MIHPKQPVIQPFSDVAYPLLLVAEDQYQPITIHPWKAVIHTLQAAIHSLQVHQLPTIIDPLQAEIH